MNENLNDHSEEKEPAPSDSVGAPVPRRARRSIPSFAKEEAATQDVNACASVQEPAPSAADSADVPAHQEVPAEPKQTEMETGEEESASLTDEENKKPEKKEEVLTGGANLFDWIKSFLFSLTAVVFIFTLLFRGVTVDGGSMQPTLSDAEYLIISDLFYKPQTGDIVVVQSPHYKNGSEPLIKRVIATGGQTVRINFETWQVWVDDVELSEDYILKVPGMYMEPEDMEYDEDGIAEIKVEKDCIFVMGDNRNNSLDSRSQAVGQINERYIMGRVVLRVTPTSKFGKVA